MAVHISVICIRFLSNVRSSVEFVTI